MLNNYIKTCNQSYVTAAIFHKYNSNFTVHCQKEGIYNLKAICKITIEGTKVMPP